MVRPETSNLSHHADLTGIDLSNTICIMFVQWTYKDVLLSSPTNWQCVRNYLVGPYADLTSADLEGANLSYADLSYADLSNAYLDNADLSNAE